MRRSIAASARATTRTSWRATGRMWREQLGVDEERIADSVAMAQPRCYRGRGAVGCAQAAGGRRAWFRPRRAWRSAFSPPIARRFCSPMPQAKVIGAAHAGWKGALAGMTDATIAAMERLGAKRERIVAVIGPTIGQASYEVGPELHRFHCNHPTMPRFFSDVAGNQQHYRFDLPGYLAGEARGGRRRRCGRCRHRYLSR